jgi:MSHA biogenesis protein MshP
VTRLNRLQHGFAAIAAIFLVVVLAALGGFMLTFFNTQQLTSAQDIQGTRAYWAARAGLEWGLSRVAASTTAGTIAPTCPASSTTVSSNFDGGFSVLVNCQQSDYTEGPSGPNHFIFQFTSVATSTTGAPGSVGYIQRSVSSSMECVKNNSAPLYSCG